MRGFEIIYKDKVIRVSMDGDCQPYVMAHYLTRDGSCMAAIGRVNRKSHTAGYWWECKNLVLGDTIKVRLTEFDEETPPVTTTFIGGERRMPQTKLERFHELVQHMKREGIDISEL